MEKDAYLIFWTDIGQKMGIQDIPPTLEELKNWCEVGYHFRWSCCGLVQDNMNPPTDLRRH
jgi:hypothetical protein